MDKDLLSKNYKLVSVLIALVMACCFFYAYVATKADVIILALGVLFSVLTVSLFVKSRLKSKNN